MHRRLFPIFVLLGAAGFFGLLPLRATSVVAPSFAELVSEAQVIVRGTVQAVRCAWVETPQGRLIKTYVTFAVEKRLKGPAPEELVLEFLGGEIDGEGMRVEGMPQFAAGRREILFVSGNGVRFCPLVGMMHGRYHVMKEAATAREFITRDDGVPLENPDDVQLPQGLAAAAGHRARVGLPAEAFEQAIAAEAAPRALR